MRHSRTARLCLIFALLGTLAFFGACGKAEKGTQIIIDDPTRTKYGHNLYSEPGGLGGTTEWVNVGEFAEQLEERQVGGELAGAIPGVWVKVRTLYDPREGWIEKDNTRPAATK
ncbi:MAG: hypothetical protein Q8R92_18500 [Deltaproteobacteria bacterium]|nr:hypothetical protein [Deltaproteobacteria bacterium]